MRVDRKASPNATSGGAWDFPHTTDPATALSTQGVVSVNRAHYFRVRDGGTISKIALQVIQSSGNICVAAYKNSGTGRNAVPGTRLATSGSVACPAAGYAEVALDSSVAVEPGDWLAIAADNTTVTFNAGSSGTATGDLGKGRQGYQDTAFPLPSTPALSASAIAGRLICLIGVNA